jgi:hypothetical protein
MSQKHRKCKVDPQAQIAVITQNQQNISLTSSQSLEIVHAIQTSIPSGSIPTHNSKKQAAAGTCLRPYGHWGRHGMMIVQKHVQETNHSPISDPILGMCLKNRCKIMTPSIRTVGINKVLNCLIKTRQHHYLLK